MLVFLVQLHRIIFLWKAVEVPKTMDRTSISDVDCFSFIFRAALVPLSLKSLKGDWEGKKMMEYITVFPSLSMTHPTQTL